jgi:transposase-like protein
VDIRFSNDGVEHLSVVAKRCILMVEAIKARVKNEVFLSDKSQAVRSWLNEVNLLAVGINF